MTHDPGERLDRAPWRRVHSRILLALGIGWALDSFEVQILGSVITPLAAEFGLLGPDGAVQPGALSVIWTVWFAGLLVGAAGFGWLADRFGRKRLFVVTLVLYATAAVLTALAPTFGLLLVFRFVTAVGVGGEYSAITSAITEFVPARRRGTAVAATMNFWALGGIAAGLVGIVFLNGFVGRQLVISGMTLSGWRLALLVGACAAIYAMVARRAIPESPRWLAAQGRREEADRIVTAITGFTDNTAGLRSTTDSSPPRKPGFVTQVRLLWAASPSRLVYGMVLDFSGSGAYYGLFTFVGAYVLVPTQVDVSTGDVPAYYLVGNLGALLGGISVALVVDRIGRGATVVTAYSAAAVSVLVLAAAALTRSSGLTLAAFTLAVFSATCTWISAYATFAELFPTSLRATGIGVCVGAGRVGGAVGVVGLSYTTGTLGLVPAFLLLAAFFGLGTTASVVWRRRGPEGRGRPLDNISAGRGGSLDDPARAAGGTGGRRAAE